MADRGADLAALPKEVKDQLAELELELSEGNPLDGLILNCGLLTIDVHYIECGVNEAYTLFSALALLVGEVWDFALNYVKWQLT